MPLVSRWFGGNARLQSCLVSDPAHVLTGDSGEHVSLVQEALVELDEARIRAGRDHGRPLREIDGCRGPGYKKKRGIINRAYQTAPDNIVGKMTVRYWTMRSVRESVKGHARCWRSRCQIPRWGSSSRKATRSRTGGRPRSSRLTKPS